MDLSNPCRIWHRQEIERKDGRIVKLRFQDMPQSRMEEVVDFSITYFLKEDSFTKASGIYKNEEAIDEYRLMVSTLFMMDPPHVTICCVDNDTDEGGKLIGVSSLMLLDRSDASLNLAKQFPVKTKEMESFFKMSIALDDSTDLHKKFSCHYHGVRLLVHPEYRGLGIANEFMRIRTIICKEHRVPMIASWQTAIAGQKAAAKNNFKIYTEVEPNFIGKMCDVKFDDKTPTFKLMYTTVDITKCKFKSVYKRIRRY